MAATTWIHRYFMIPKIVQKRSCPLVQKSNTNRSGELGSSHFLLQLGEENEKSDSISKKQAQSQGLLLEAGSGKVLLLGLKGDSLTITFYSESLRRQFKYHLLKGNAKQFSLGC